MRQASEGDSSDWEEHSRGDHLEACWGQTKADGESDRGGRVLSGPQQTGSVYWQACPCKYIPVLLHAYSWKIKVHATMNV